MRLDKFKDFSEKLDIKDIEIDDIITYKGTTYKVEEVDDYIVKMRDDDDILIEVNSNMIKNAIKKGRY
jgi:hypothetical protein